MKKKFLSALMAGAMVMGMVIPTHAAVIQGEDDRTHDANVTVSGVVNSKDNTAPAGKIQVEVPTELTFMVDKNGVLSSGQYTITNQGSSSVDVMVGSFRDTSENAGITVHENEDNFAQLDRSNITLKLSSNTGEVNLGGVIDSSVVLSKVDAGNSERIHLTGSAGSKVATDDETIAVDENGTSDRFNLVFKIKKSMN